MGDDVGSQCVEPIVLRKEIVTTLESGTHILMDRYAFSGVAYSVGAEVSDY